MPLYEYSCDACGETIEALQRFSDPPLEKCSSCGGNLERLVSAPAIQFKGTGWYVTDYGNKSDQPDQSKTNKNDKAETTKDSAESSTSKTESKKKVEAKKTKAKEKS